jgi:hypothetical protein
VFGHVTITDRGPEFTRWPAGTVVELDPADAAWIAQDSPGALEPIDRAELNGHDLQRPYIGRQ